MGNCVHFRRVHGDKVIRAVLSEDKRAARPAGHHVAIMIEDTGVETIEIRPFLRDGAAFFRNLQRPALAIVSGEQEMRMVAALELGFPFIENAGHEAGEFLGQAAVQDRDGPVVVPVSLRIERARLEEGDAGGEGGAAARPELAGGQALLIGTKKGVGDGGDDIGAGRGAFEGDEGGGGAARRALADDGADAGEVVREGNVAPVVGTENVAVEGLGVRKRIAGRRRPAASAR